MVNKKLPTGSFLFCLTGVVMRTMSNVKFDVIKLNFRTKLNQRGDVYEHST